MVDREFDIEIGVKSTAILFGDADKLIIGSLQAMFIVSLWLAGRQFEMGAAFNWSLVVASTLLIYQQFLIRDRLPGPCFNAFLNNNWVGAVVFVVSATDRGRRLSAPAVCRAAVCRHV